MKALLAFLSLTLFFFSCSKPSVNNSEASILTVDSTHLDLADSNSTAVFHIHSNVSWAIDVQNTSDWLEVSVLTGNGDSTILIRAVKSNYESSERETSIRLFSPQAPDLNSITIDISQKNSLQLVFSRTAYGGTIDEEFRSGIITTDRQLLLFGSTDSRDGDVVPAIGGKDFWLVKMNTAGNILWQKRYGSAGDDWGLKVIHSNDNNYLMIGVSQNDLMIIKTDTSGNIIWEKKYGGSGYEYAQSITPGVNGGYVLQSYTLSSDGNISHPYGMMDIWVIKIDESGNLEWEKSFGGSSSEGYGNIITLKNGHYLFCGTSQSEDGLLNMRTSNDDDVWIVELDESGNLVRHNVFGGTGNEWRAGVIQRSNGELYFAATTQSTDGQVVGNHSIDAIWFVHIDDHLQFQSGQILGIANQDFYDNIIETSDGDFIITGESSTPMNNTGTHKGQKDAFVCRISPDGTVKMNKTLGGSFQDYGFQSLEISPDHFLLIGVTASHDQDVVGFHRNDDAFLTPYN